MKIILDIYKIILNILKGLNINRLEIRVPINSIVWFEICISSSYRSPHLIIYTSFASAIQWFENYLINNSKNPCKINAFFKNVILNTQNKSTRFTELFKPLFYFGILKLNILSYKVSCRRYVFLYPY